MIQSFVHNGLERFHRTGNHRGINPNHVNRIRVRLSAMEDAQSIQELNMPGFNLHLLQGPEPRRWSIHINGPWCITFEFRDGHCYDVDYENYH